MSAKSIQNALYKSYAKVGNALGFDTVVYRPVDYTLPTVDLANWVCEMKVAFSLDPKFQSTFKRSLAVWMVWADGNNLKVGDVLVCKEDNRAFFIAAMQSQLAISALEVTNTLQVSRVKYAKVNGVQTKEDIVVAKGIAAYVETAGAQDDANGNPAPHSSVGRWAIYCYADRGIILIDDILTNEFGVKMRVKEAGWTAMGYKISAIEVQ